MTRPLISIEGFVHIFTGVILFTIFLSVFYFTYASKIEGEIVTEQINITVDSFTKNMKDFNISIPLDSINKNKPSLEDQDKKIQESNHELIIDATKYIGISTAVIVVIFIVLYIFYPYNIKDILVSNGILIVFVAIIEFFSLLCISARYQSLDPNQVKLNVINNIDKF